jgi:hypothetical protein
MPFEPTHPRHVAFIAMSEIRNMQTGSDPIPSSMFMLNNVAVASTTIGTINSPNWIELNALPRTPPKMNQKKTYPESWHHLKEMQKEHPAPDESQVTDYNQANDSLLLRTYYHTKRSFLLPRQATILEKINVLPNR